MTDRSGIRTEYPPIDTERLWARVEALSRMTQPDEPWTRRAFSPLFDEARGWLTEQMRGAGLQVRTDAGGNLIGSRPGRAALAPLVTGSHCDTVAGGGRFDGIIGVLAGIEVAHMLQEQGVTLRHPLEVIDFLAEEPNDFGSSCVGSRAMAGTLGAEMLTARAAGGESLAEAMRRIGARPHAIAEARRFPGGVAAFVELHIEQGPVLETRGIRIGVVGAIVGIGRFSLSVIGRPDHAGTTPMHMRRDALVGAARIIDTTYRLARSLSDSGQSLVATIGRASVTPNAANAIPGRVDLVLEVRSESDEWLRAFPNRLFEDCEAAMENLGLRATLKPLSHSPPVACHPSVIEVIEHSAHKLGYGSLRMSSGAGHDAAHIAAVAPSGMIFVPCRDGRSHCPEEWIEPDQLLDGARVLYETLRALDEQDIPPTGA